MALQALEGSALFKQMACSALFRRMHSKCRPCTVRQRVGWVGGLAVRSKEHLYSKSAAALQQDREPHLSGRLSAAALRPTQQMQALCAHWVTMHQVRATHSPDELTESISLKRMSFRCSCTYRKRQHPPAER